MEFENFGVVSQEADFSQPVEANFIVSLKNQNDEFGIFVEAFVRKNGKPYMRSTTDIRAAKRFSKFTAFDVLEKVKEYRCLGRVEKVSADNQVREVVNANGPSEDSEIVVKG